VAGVVAAKADLIAQAIRAVIGVADPHLVVLSGGVRRAEREFLDLVAAQVAAHAPVLPKWRVSALGDNAVVDGCMAAGNDCLTTSALD
jgi:predicted NBD/HSP70 family sugar kinase